MFVINNKYLQEYLKLVSIDLLKLDNISSVDNILNLHKKLNLENHLLANKLLFGCCENIQDRTKIEYDSLLLIQDNLSVIDDLKEYLHFPRFLTNDSRDNYRNAQFNRSKEVQDKMSNSNRGKKRTSEAKQKMSLSHKGRESWNKGIPLSEETREKLRKANLGKRQSEETKQKRKDSLHKLKWWNNGIIQVRRVECPDGENWVSGRLPNQLSEEARKKCLQKGKKWYTNGLKNIMAFDCPEGYWPGRTDKIKNRIPHLDNKEV